MGTPPLACLPNEHYWNISQPITMDGKYILTSNENYDCFLKTVGVPDELAGKMCATKPCVEVTFCATGVTLVVTAGDKTFSNTLTFGQDSPSEIAGLKYTINVNKTATGYAGTMKLGNHTGTVSTEKTADGFVQCMTVGGVTCKRHYKKQ